MKSYHAAIISLVWLTANPGIDACCPVAPLNSHVINTDQSVIMIWDKQTQTQHFIRKADFKTDAKDIGFLVPSPSRPQLNESGNAAFEKLAEITAPTKPRGGGISFGCAGPIPESTNAGVMVIEEKRVAGYDATVLTARSGTDLVEWLKNNGYPYSPAIAEWAKPYLGGDWHFTALKLVKDSKPRQENALKASALRISFTTARPLFPYREPDSGVASEALNNSHRTLRIYFIADTQYEGKINGRHSWSANTMWSGDITSHRAALLRELKLPPNTGSKKWWLTEFQDQWPYEKAAGDLYFSQVAKSMVIDRDGKHIPYKMDAAFLGLIALFCLMKARREK